MEVLHRHSAGSSVSVHNGKHSDLNLQHGCSNGDMHKQDSSCDAQSASCGWTCKLVKFSQLPYFLQDNEYLRQHFRPQLNSYIQCFKSIFRLHTETCNIWSHIIGAGMFLYLMITHLASDSPSLQKTTFSVFYVGAIVCMGMSATFHTMTCHSANVHRTFAKLDYCAIIMLVVTSFCPWMYYIFYCDAVLRNTYLCMAATFGTISLIITLHNQFGQPKYRPLRAGLFIALGLTGAFPGVHYFILRGFFATWWHMGWLLLMAATYIAGGLIYAARIPERFFPGVFDIWGHSHTILHICVILAALSCYHGAHKLSQARQSGAYPC